MAEARSEYENHKGHLAQMVPDFDQGLQVALDLVERQQEGQKEFFKQLGPELATAVLADTRKLRAGVQWIFQKHRKDQGKPIRDLKTFGDEQDEAEVNTHHNSATSPDAQAFILDTGGMVAITVREALCLLLTSQYLESLTPEERQKEVRQKLMDELSQRKKTPPVSLQAHRASTAEEWMAIKLAKDLWYPSSPVSSDSGGR
jgi:hypothetical protein